MLEVNDALVELMGYESKQALMARSIPGLYVRTQDRDALLERISTTGSVGGVEIPVEREDGSVLWTRMSATAERDADGCIQALACVVEAVDDKDRPSQADRALAESEHRYRALVELSPLGIVIHQDGEIRFANRATADLLGAEDPDALIGEPVLGFVHPDEHDKARSRVARIYDGATLGPTVYRLERLDGTVFPAQVQGGFVPFDGRGASQLILQDITERRREEKERQAWMAELERSNEELEQFAHIVSHDLREPLRMLHQYALLLEDRLETEDEQIDAAVGHLRAGARDACDLLDALLGYSRVTTEETSFEPVDLDAAVETACRHLELLIDETEASIETEPLGTADADQAQIVQLLQNLIENAIKYSGDAPPHVEIRTLPAREGTHLLIQDHGVGMDPDRVDEAFTPFRQLDPEASIGAGIGLAICRRILDRHGGEIWATSELGVGTAVHIHLPKRSSQTPPVPGPG